MKRARNWQELRREVSSYDNHAENLLPAHWVFGIEAFVDAVRLHSEAVECELRMIFKRLVEISRTHLISCKGYMTTSNHQQGVR